MKIFGIPRYFGDSSYSEIISVPGKRIYISYLDESAASESTYLHNPVSKTTSSATNPADMIASVSDALSSVPAALHVAEFSLKCNRKDTCRSLITGSIEIALALKARFSNIVSVDFATSTTVGSQASVYGMVRAFQS